MGLANAGPTIFLTARDVGRGRDGISLKIFCYRVAGHDAPYLVRTRHGKWPGPVSGRSGLRMCLAAKPPAQKWPPHGGVRRGRAKVHDCNDDTLRTSVTDGVFPILLGTFGNRWLPRVIKDRGSRAAFKKFGKFRSRPAVLQIIQGKVLKADRCIS